MYLFCHFICLLNGVSPLISDRLPFTSDFFVLFTMCGLQGHVGASEAGARTFYLSHCSQLSKLTQTWGSTCVADRILSNLTVLGVTS